MASSPEWWMDRTQGVTSTEQESLCFRQVDAELKIKEDFVGQTA